MKKSWINKVSEKDKLQYFDELLESNDTVYDKFQEHFSKKMEIEKSCDLKELDELVDSIYLFFSNVDIELYLNDRCGRYDYYYEDTYDDILDDIFLEYEKNIDNFLKNDREFEALFLIVAIYKAILKNPTVDDYAIFYDYAEALMESLFVIIDKFIKHLLQNNVSNAKKEKFIKFLSSHGVDSENIKVFESLVDALVNSKEMAVYASKYIDSFFITNQLNILNLLEEDDKYIEAAKKFYKENTQVADLLLKKLALLEEYNQYEQIAKECFKEMPNYFVQNILTVINYKKSPEFYIDILRYKSVHNNSFEDYKKLKKYINKDELKPLIEDIKKTSTAEFYVFILKYEKMYSDILTALKECSVYNLELFLEPIKTIYPKECFEIVVKNCEESLMRFDRNRKIYQKMCFLLKIIKSSKLLEDELATYISKIYNHKPNLPALKDELRKAKLFI